MYEMPLLLLRRPAAPSPGFDRIPMTGRGLSFGSGAVQLEDELSELSWWS